MGKWMKVCYIVGYKCLTIMDGIKFEFNDITLLHTKTILSEDGWSANNIIRSMFDDVIVKKVINFNIRQ